MTILRTALLSGAALLLAAPVASAAPIVGLLADGTLVQRALRVGGGPRERLPLVRRRRSECGEAFLQSDLHLEDARAVARERLERVRDEIAQPRRRDADVLEFDARVALYADMARQREESERQIKAMGADEDRRYSALNAETQRLKKALAEAERKLEAVAEMERTLTPESQ